MRAWREAQTADTSPHTPDERVNWKEIERHVLRLQRQLAHAVEQGKRKAVRHYKWLIRTSHHVKLLAIRHVTQENQGRRTPGVDGKTYTTPATAPRTLRTREFASSSSPRPTGVRPQEERKTPAFGNSHHPRPRVSGHPQDGNGTRVGHSICTQYLRIPTSALDMGRDGTSLHEPEQTQLTSMGD